MLRLLRCESRMCKYMYRKGIKCPIVQARPQRCLRNNICEDERLRSLQSATERCNARVLTEQIQSIVDKEMKTDVSSSLW